MKLILRLVALSTLLFALPSDLPAATPNPRWNLLIITADDMNHDSWFNSPVKATPNLDAFAATCYRFEQCHVAAPICQPSRSAMMTGRVPHRNGALGFNPIRLDVPTLTEITSSNGYFTAAINKIAHMQPKVKFNWDLALDGSGKNPSLMREHFEQCLKGAADAGKPFFVNANITDPHRPFAGSTAPDAEENAEKKKRPNAKGRQNASPVELYAPAEVLVPSFLEDIPGVRKEVAQYFSSVRRLNQTFTGLMEALKASGHADDTLIVFMSDHGMSFPFAKATIYRNGTTSPLLLKWPGLTKPFVNQTDFVNSIDIMPTVLELLSLPKPPGMDGRSFLPILKGEKQNGRDHLFTYVNTVSSGKAFPGRCIRTKSRAYLWNSWPDGKTQYRVEAMSGLSFKALAEAATRDPKIKARVEQYLFRMPEEFYDEENDPDERVNLINDPKYRSEIEQMKAQLLAEMKRSGDPLLEQFQGGGKQTASPATAKSIGTDAATGGAKCVIVDETAALAHTGQVFPINRRGRMVLAANVARQVAVVLENLDALLKTVGSDLGQVVKLNVYLAEESGLAAVRETLANRFSGGFKPAVSYVVGTLAEPGAVVAMDAVATCQLPRPTVMRWSARDGAGFVGATVLAAGNPKLYISGMADTNSLLPATEKTLEKLVAVLVQLGSKREDILQLKVFVQPIAQSSAVRGIIARFFDGKPPPISLVEWISANPAVEIELVAWERGDFRTEADTVSYLTPPGTTSSKVYSRVARVNHGQTIYLSGLYGRNVSDAAGEIRDIFAQLDEVSKQTGSDFEHLVKATYYVTDNDASDQLNALRPEYYNPLRPPAASKARVKGVGLAGKAVTLDMIAVTK